MLTDWFARTEREKFFRNEGNVVYEKIKVFQFLFKLNISEKE